MPVCCMGYVMVDPWRPKKVGKSPAGAGRDFPFFRVDARRRRKEGEKGREKTEERKKEKWAQAGKKNRRASKVPPSRAPGGVDALAYKVNTVCFWATIAPRPRRDHLLHTFRDVLPIDIEVLELLSDFALVPRPTE